MTSVSRALVVCLTLTWLTIPAAAVRAQDARPTVAILDFEYGAVREHWMPSRQQRGRTPTLAIDPLNVGRGIADLLVTELATDGQLRLLERQRIADVARERQEPGTSRARYLVMGAVTKFGAEEKTKGGATVLMGLLGLAAHRPLMGAFSLKENDANVDLSCRIVDTTSGEIVGAVGGSGQSQRRGVRVAGFGGFPALGGGALNVQSADFQSTILGEATLDAVRDAATKLRRLLLTRQ